VEDSAEEEEDLSILWIKQKNQEESLEVLELKLLLMTMMMNK
jgi:hypothetical protein